LILINLHTLQEKRTIEVGQKCR